MDSSKEPTFRNDDFKVFETNDGKVRGVRQTTLIKKVDFYSFKGIPYAKSPTGELRFKAPEPIESWSPKVLDAFEHGPISIQSTQGSVGNDWIQSEDCLFLNIYVPAHVKSDDKLAVLAYIHGGGYLSGSGNDDWYGPDFLIEQNVIVATLNYRLGVLGFMSFGTPEYSGNMGLKDQQLALKWIHSNIHHFSGDNQRVTIFGESAGGASTHLQMLSSESRKYFRNAIPMSGTADDVWAMSRNSDHLVLAHKIAEDFGQTKQSPEELIEYLKTIPAEKFIEYSSGVAFTKRTFLPELTPIVERKDAIRPFIVDLPSKIYDQSKIELDAMFSFCSSEFGLFYSAERDEILDLKGFDCDFNLILPFRDVNLPFDAPEYRSIAKEIRAFYFKDAAIDEKTLKQYIDLLSDVNFTYGIDKSTRLHASKSPSKTFYLRFSVDSKLNILKRQCAASHLPGAIHTDDLAHVFRINMFQQVYDEILENKEDEQSQICLKTIENMTKMFVNFAKYGWPTHEDDPVKEFLPIQGDQINFLDVTNDGLKTGVNPNQKANELWTKIEKLVRNA